MSPKFLGYKHLSNPFMTFEVMHGQVYNSMPTSSMGNYLASSRGHKTSPRQSGHKKPQWDVPCYLWLLEIMWKHVSIASGLWKENIKYKYKVYMKLCITKADKT